MENREALIQKAADIIQSQCNENGYCALTLMDLDDRPVTTTITPAKADGIKWMTFCTGYGTRTQRIAHCKDACVCFNSQTYHISLKGRAEVVTDPNIKRDMWYDGLKHHFSGPDDPGYIVIRFTADSYTLFVDWQEVRGTLS